MKKWLNIFIYISLAFLLYALWKADYLKIPEIENYFYLALSIAFLLCGYITKSIVWTKGLKSENIQVGLKDGIASTGIAELGKYIPGKLWVLMGRALFISSHYPISTARASAISLNVQMLTVWSGLLVGLIGMLFIAVPLNWIIPMLLGWIALSVVLYVKKIHDLFLKLLRRISKRNIQIPFINVMKQKEILFWLFFDWLIRMTAFYLLIISLSDFSLNYAVALGFPLAVTLGILAIIVPGGMGVREGVLGIWLKNAGLGIEMATSIAVFARLWSLLGELMVFIVGIILRHLKK